MDSAKIVTAIRGLEQEFTAHISDFSEQERRAVLAFDPIIQDVPKLVEAARMLERIDELRTELDRHNWYVDISEQAFCQCFD